jgi:hypothetical protein
MRALCEKFVRFHLPVAGSNCFVFCAIFSVFTYVRSVGHMHVSNRLALDQIVLCIMQHFSEKNNGT